jgi:hypothetical protein
VGVVMCANHDDLARVIAALDLRNNVREGFPASLVPLQGGSMAHFGEGCLDECRCRLQGLVVVDVPRADLRGEMGDVSFELFPLADRASS